MAILRTYTRRLNSCRITVKPAQEEYPFTISRSREYEAITGPVQFGGLPAAGAVLGRERYGLSQMAIA